MIRNNINRALRACLVCCAICAATTACMDKDWDTPSFSEGAPFGNNDITEEGLISISDLLDKYPNVYENPDRNVQITENIKIKGYVTGNDLGGNLYKQVVISDESSAIMIAINQNGLNGYMAEGQEVLVDLKGLYIGGYAQMPEIGQPYNGNSIGRMSKDVWAQHYKLIGEPKKDLDCLRPMQFTKFFAQFHPSQIGQLVVLKNVTFPNANGKTAFAGKNATTSGGNYVNHTVTVDGLQVIVRTSTYADFAAMKLPYDTVAHKAVPCNLTGILSRFANDWQLLIRKTSDIEVLQ